MIRKNLGRLDLLFIFLVIALAVGVRLVFCRIAEGDWDDYMFGLYGREVLSGKLPYSGVFEHKPVGLAYVFATFEYFFGSGLLAIRLIALVAAAASAWLLCRIVSLFDGAKPALAALSAAACYLALSVANGGLSSMSELIVSPLLLSVLYLGFLWSLKRMHSTLFCVAAGALFGAAAQINYLVLPICVMFMLAFAVCALWDRTSLSRIAGLLVLSVLSFAVVFCLILVPQWLRGLLGEYFSLQFHFLQSYQAKMSLREQLQEIWFPVAKFVAPLAIVLVPFVLSRNFRGLLPAEHDRRRALLFTLAGLSGALISFVASGHFYGHYFLLSLPFLVILMALTLLLVPERARPATNFAVVMACGLVALHVAHFVNTLAHRAFFPEVVAESVRKWTKPNDLIFVFNDHHEIYYLSGRPLMSRFVFPSQYLDERTMNSVGTSTQAVVDQALNAKPKLVILGSMIPRISIMAGLVEGLERRLHAEHYERVETLNSGESRAELYLAK